MLLLLPIIISFFNGWIPTNQNKDLDDFYYYKFLSMHKKDVAVLKSGLETDNQKEVFIENLKFITSFNQQAIKDEESLRLGVNELADVPQDSFLSKYASAHHAEELLSSAIETKEPSNLTLQPVIIPAALDWRTSGALPVVKSQGGCGACWAFSALDTLSARWAIKYGRIQDLSVQQMVNCIPECKGCKGCSPLQAQGWLKHNAPLEDAVCPQMERDMPNSCCNIRQVNNPIHSPLKHIILMQQGDIAGLKMAVSSGPVTSLIAVNNIFQFQVSGVLTPAHCPPTKVNHAVITVGYTPDQWIVRNSFGPRWGQGGQAKISMQQNACNILDQNIYPEL